jgi:uncharacterized repeat protein (TIGR03803 family)
MTTAVTAATLGFVAGLILDTGTAARAQTLAVIGTVSGGPAISAIKGSALYGVVPYGGGDGTLFSLSTVSGSTTLLHTFDGATDGDGANSPLALDAGGDVFGMSSAGGADGGGTLWEYSASGSFSVVHVFGSVPNDGTVPLQGPILAGGSVLLGTTSRGAIGTNGALFAQHLGRGYSTLHDFLSGTDGHCPFSGITRDAHGNTYGTTVGKGFGGNPNGSVWKLPSRGKLTTIYVFQDGADGEWPDQAPVSDKAGDLYGTTHIRNGAQFDGAIWTISAAGSFTVLHDFVSATDGSGPAAPLVIGLNGTIYGTTSSGGKDGYGTVFSITPTGNFKVLWSFTGGSDGTTPTGPLVVSAKGVIYGGTASGQVFAITP